MTDFSFRHPEELNSKAIDTWKSLGEHDPSRLYEEWRTAAMSSVPPEPLVAESRYRDLTLTSAALGELAQAGKATDYPLAAVSGNIDLGGAALRRFMYSEKALQLWKNVPPGKAEIPDALQFESRIHADEKLILGKHDIGSIESNLTSAHEHSSVVSRMIERISTNLQTLVQSADGTEERRVLTAKLCRDAAVLGESIVASELQNGFKRAAGTMLDGGLQQNGHNVNTWLQMAEKLDPTNPDLAQLKQIAADQRRSVWPTQPY